MKFDIENIPAQEIERRSFAMISELLGERTIAPEHEAVVKRVIHTTADFEYLETLMFSEDVVPKALAAFGEGATIVTDTQMALAGINKTALAKIGCKAHCFMAEEETAKRALANGTTRAAASMERAAQELPGPLIFAIGNAPTALIRLYELILENAVQPKLIIGVPVGFVNVIQSKELIMSADVPYIISKGRKGGSNVAAAIINALLYQC